MSDLLRLHELYSSWNSPGQNTGVGSLSVLHGIFPTQELNQGLPHCRQILYQLSYQGSPFYIVDYHKTLISIIAVIIIILIFILQTLSFESLLLGSIPGLGRSPGEGKGYPLQYSALENSMDSVVHGVAKSQTGLSDFHLFHFLYHLGHQGSPALNRCSINLFLNK